MATQFDFENIGSMFAGGMGGTPSGLDALLSEDQRKLMGRNAALSAAAALLQAGGRSPQRIGLGQALGSALQAGQQSYQQGRAGSLQDLLLAQKLEEAKRVATADAGFLKFLQSPEGIAAAAAPSAPPAPLTGVAVPPIERFLSETMPVAAAPAAAPNVLGNLSQQQRALVASLGREKGTQYLLDMMKPQETVGQPFQGQDGKFYIQTKTGGVIAAPVAPAAKPSGAPQQVMGADGKPALVQNYDDGTYKIVSGVSPLITPQQVDTGSGIQFVNPFSTPAGKVIPKGMSPSDAANLRIRQAEFNRGAFDIRDTPEGLVYVPKAPGGAAMPITGPGGVQLEGTGAKPTEDQSKSAGFAFRMKQSTNIFNQPILGKDGQPVLDPTTQKPVTLEQAYGQPNRYQAIMRAVPTAGLTTGIANVSETAGRQQYRQAQENWVTANLRPESGAVIGVEEMEKEITKYFPQTNDKPETIAQKAQARRDTELAMIVRAGPAYKQIEKAVAARSQPGAARLVQDPATGIFRYVTE